MQPCRDGNLGVLELWPLWIAFHTDSDSVRQPLEALAPAFEGFNGTDGIWHE